VWASMSDVVPSVVNSVLAALREPVALSEEDLDGCVTYAACVAASIAHRRGGAHVGQSLSLDLARRGFAIVRVSK